MVGVAAQQYIRSDLEGRHRAKFFIGRFTQLNKSATNIYVFARKLAPWAAFVEKTHSRISLRGQPTTEVAAQWSAMQWCFTLITTQGPEECWRICLKGVGSR
jgi:hypothetical protein